MPLRVINHTGPQRKSQPLSRTSSSASTDNQIDSVSVLSSHSSSENTLFSEPKYSLEDIRPVSKYPDEGITQKLLPVLPSQSSNAEHKRLNSAPINLSDYEQSPFSEIRPLTRVPDLSFVIGTDNTPYDAEIATIPCAGVRIPQGPLTGLLAWRLVVRAPPSLKDRGNWWNAKSGDTHKKGKTPVQHIRPSSSAPVIKDLTASTVSLPMHSNIQQHMYPLVDSSFYSPNIQEPIHSSPASHTNAVVTNFILDTSLPYSIISRDTLIALGYPAHGFPSPETSAPHQHHHDNFSMNRNDFVTLSIQNVVTKLRIARPGEASRLGVQFLQDAGVSLFSPNGIGPVLYLESARSFQDVPRTVYISSGSAKMSLPQRIRALFGLTS